MSSLDQQITQARPSEQEIAAELTPERSQMVLDQVLLRVRCPAPVAPPPSRRWVLGTSLVVALGLGAAAVGAQLLDRPQPPTVPAPATPALSTAAPQHSTATPASTSAVIGRDGTSLLPEIATKAGVKAPPQIGPSQFLHEVCVSEQTGESAGRTTDDTYAAADGWTWRRSDKGYEVFWLILPPSRDTIARLPDDPARLDAALRRGTGSSSADERVFKGVHEMLSTHETTPAQRKAAVIVLESLARNPQRPVRTKDGQLASPRVAVTQVRLDNGDVGVRAAQTDPTSRPGIEHYLVLTLDGTIVASGSSGPDGTFTSTVTRLEVVDALPADFVAKLGTAKVAKESVGR